MMILFYKNYFFPAGHVDEGKPIPLGLCGQLGSRPHSLSNEWFSYKALMAEFDIKGYSHPVRNGDDPIQDQLRQNDNIEIDARPFAELYHIGLEKIGITTVPHIDSALLPKIINYTQRTMAVVSSFNSFIQEHPRLQDMTNNFARENPTIHTAQTVISGADALLQIARSTKSILKL